MLHSVNNPQPLVQQAPSPPPKPSTPMYVPNKPLPLPPGSRRASISQSPSVDISRASRSLTVSGDSSAPPVMLGLHKSESAAISSSSSSSHRSSLSCSPSNEFQIEAPKFAESLAFKLLHCYPRVRSSFFSSFFHHLFHHLFLVVKLINGFYGSWGKRSH